MNRIRKRLSPLTKIEKIIVTFLSLLVLVTSTQIGYAFYDEHSEVTPVSGGIYVEGAVGKVATINPLYVQYGTLTHDLTQLIYSGLSKYDPLTGEIVSDLADHTVSDDGKEYTFTIKEGATWHDGTPVTANDVLFTYNTVINDPSFGGLILNYNDYSGMKVAKIDDQTVQFLLEAPDSFFLVRTTTGLLPDHLLGHLPVQAIEGAPFNLFPTGTGPYQFVSMNPVNGIIEVTLEAYPGYYGQKPNISTIQLKVFNSYKDLVKKQAELDGLRNVPPEYVEKIEEKGRMNLVEYQLPQYVAAFINTESPILKSNKVRLALQLGTDKRSLVAAIGQNQVIDTPLLEIDQSNWVYQHSVKKANGALYETAWQLPKKAQAALEEEESEETEEEEVIDPNDTSKVTFINNPNAGNDWSTTDEKITITGTVPPKTKAVTVNDYELGKFVPGDPGWTYIASFEFENLVPGKNVYKVYATDFDGEVTLIDSITIAQGTKEQLLNEELVKLDAENQVANVLPVRTNANGDPLVLRLIAPENPASYSQVANLLKEQWTKIGVGVEIEVLESLEFQKRLFKRDYDLLIFGQNLGYNLDAYPYWHSSQAKEGGYNLSQFKNFAVDSLLDKARLESGDDRKETLTDIQQIITDQVPAVFLYSPTYHFAQSEKIQNASFENLATTSDRFAGVANWYGKLNRKLQPGTTPFTFAGWLLKQF